MTTRDDFSAIIILRDYCNHDDDDDDDDSYLRLAVQHSI